MVERNRGAVRSAALVATTLVALAGIPSLAGAEPSPTRQAELRHLLTQDCGSCHGLTLAGGLGPSLLAKDLANKPPELIVAAILYGRAGTAMPPWQPFLSAEEAAWLAQLMKQQIP